MACAITAASEELSLTDLLLGRTEEAFLMMLLVLLQIVGYKTNLLVSFHSFVAKNQVVVQQMEHNIVAQCTICFLA